MFLIKQSEKLFKILQIYYIMKKSVSVIVLFFIIMSVVYAFNEYDVGGSNDFSLYYMKSAPEIVDLYIDGEFIGFTPAKIKGLSAGEHTVVLRKAGYRDYSTKIIVEKGVGGKILSAMTSNEGIIAEKSWAEITTECNTPCKVYINSELVGGSGMDIDLDIGSYNLKVLPIDKNHHSYNTILNINTPNNLLFNVYLASFDEYGSFDNRLLLTIYSDPSGAEVIIDNISYGVTPLGIASLKLENQTLILKKAGYLTKEMIIEQLNDRGTRYRTLALELEEGIDPVNDDDVENADELTNKGDITSKITETYASGIAKKYITISSVEAFDEYYQFKGEREGRLWALFNTRYELTVKVYADGSVKKSGPWYDFMVLDKPKR